MSLTPSDYTSALAVVLLTIAEGAGNVLPPWLVGLLVSVLVIASSLPRVLRVLDDRRITRTAAKAIESEPGALEALRILRS